MNPLSWLRRKRVGDPVVIVSGLPRSGTSALMRMLDAGGFSLLVDGARSPDDSNPHGYYELERIKHLEHAHDKSWLRQARGKGIKVISHLLRALPQENRYRVILALRDIDEVIASQNAMLARSAVSNRSERSLMAGPTDDTELATKLATHLVSARALLLSRPNFELIEVQFTDTIGAPDAVAARMDDFVGGGLDRGRMASAVEPSLYRNRAGPSPCRPMNCQN